MRPERLLGILIASLFAGAACPGELVLEDHLSSLTLRETSTTRLALGMETYRGNDWTGLRNVMRIERAPGESSTWSITLPWIYSSAEDAGFGRRGNLRGGFAWSPPPISRIRLAGEAWLPFSDNRLAPLQVKRGFLRWTLSGSLKLGSSRLAASFGRTQELRGLIGSEESLPWESWNEGELLWSFGSWSAFLPSLYARAAFGAGGSLWNEFGGGFTLHWSETWNFELRAGAYQSDQENPFPDFRLRMGFVVDFADPVMAMPEDEELQDMAREAAGENGDDEEDLPPRPPAP